MSRRFTEDEIEILKEVAVYVDEVYIDDRKGISQTSYVFTVPENCKYFCWRKNLEVEVPTDLVGTWMQSYAGDNSDIYSVKLALPLYSWVKCHKVEKTIEVWEEL